VPQWYKQYETEMDVILARVQVFLPH